MIEDTCILEFIEKRRQVKNNISEKYETLQKEIKEKNVIKLKRSGSMTSAETSIFTTEVLSKCAETLKKSLERVFKPNPNPTHF